MLKDQSVKILLTPMNNFSPKKTTAVVRLWVGQMII